MRRRRLLSVAGSSLFAAVSGCLGDDEDTNDGDGFGDSRTGEGKNREQESEGSTDRHETDEEMDRPPIETDWPWGAYASYEAIDLHVTDGSGETLGGVRAALARTSDERYLGLSDAEEMPDNGGMLFVFDTPQELTFVMRRMAFGIDIVYADGDGAITTIHHAPEPGPDEDGSQQRYPGYGQYVLEVNYEWTERHGVGEGDVLDFELPAGQ